MQALHVSRIRVLLLKVNRRAQLYLGKIQNTDRYRWSIIFIVGLFEYLRLRLIRPARTSSDKPAKSDVQSTTKRIAFVLPWYGQGIVGGAEAASYDLVQALLKLDIGIQIEVLTTTLKEFSVDWNQPFHPQGTRVEEGVTVRRFHAEPRDRSLFHFLNGTCLMPGGTDELKGSGSRAPSSPLPFWAESYYLRHMIYSSALFDHLRFQSAAYDYCIFVPYMFSPTVIGSHIMQKKALVMPCLHDERYAYMQVFQNAFRRIGGMLCLVRSEQELAQRLFPQVKQVSLIGAVADTEVPSGDPFRFRSQFGIAAEFVIYVGRQISGKNLPLLAERFLEFRKNYPDQELKLVLLGKGDLDYSQFPDIINLGFVSAQEKADALAAALCLCQPSLNESFSIVIMEAWLQKTPVIVHSDCEVTRDHCQDSRAGFAFEDQKSFDTALLDLVNSPNERTLMGLRGRDYVLERYAPEKIAKKFAKAIFAR